MKKLTTITNCIWTRIVCGVRRQHISIWTTILHFFTRKLSHSINFLPLSNANNFYPLLPVIYPIEKCSTDAQRDTRSGTSWDQLRQILWMRAEQQYQEESSLVESWQVWAGDVLCCGHVDWDLVSGHHSLRRPETWAVSVGSWPLITDNTGWRECLKQELFWQPQAYIIMVPSLVQSCCLAITNPFCIGIIWNRKLN